MPRRPPPPPATVVATFNLGVIDLNGLGGPRNCTAAVQSFGPLVGLGPWLLDLPFAVDLAYDNYASGHVDVALRQYACGAVLGLATAADNAAFLLDQGVGKGDFGVRVAPGAGDGGGGGEGSRQCVALADEAGKSQPLCATGADMEWPQYRAALAASLYHAAAVKVRCRSQPCLSVIA